MPPVHGEPVAQSVEHETFNLGVVGSSPTGLTKFFKELWRIAASAESTCFRWGFKRASWRSGQLRCAPPARPRFDSDARPVRIVRSLRCRSLSNVGLRMQTEFLTQPDVRVGDLIDASMHASGVPTEFVIVSAFASLGTVLRLRPKILALKAAACDVRVVLGVDLQGTSKEVLQEVSSWGISVTIVKNKLFGVTFHPEIYLIAWKYKVEIMVGSNNLTDGGLYRNYEAASRTTYKLPDDESILLRARSKLARFLKPSGAVAAQLTPAYLAILLSLPEIPSEAAAKRARAEGIPKRPPSKVFGYEPIAPAPRAPKGTLPPAPSPPVPIKVAKKAPDSTKTDSFAIQVRAHHNGEIFLSVTAALQNPAFFNWPFNGVTVPKKAGNPSYPQVTPDPIVDIVVYGAAPRALLRLNEYGLNTVYYATKSEIRITASPLVTVMPDNSIMIMRKSEAPNRDYDIVVHTPASPYYPLWLDACDQSMPGGGKIPRKFGWF